MELLSWAHESISGFMAIYPAGGGVRVSFFRVSAINSRLALQFEALLLTCPLECTRSARRWPWPFRAITPSKPLRRPTPDEDCCSEIVQKFLPVIRTAQERDLETVFEAREEYRTVVTSNGEHRKAHNRDVNTR